MHHLISSQAWDDAPLRRVLAEQAHIVVGGDEAQLIATRNGVISSPPRKT